MAINSYKQKLKSKNNSKKSKISSSNNNKNKTTNKKDNKLVLGKNDNVEIKLTN